MRVNSYDASEFARVLGSVHAQGTILFAGERALARAPSPPISPPPFPPRTAVLRRKRHRDAALMAAPSTDACPQCAVLRTRAEQAEAQFAEAQAQLAAIQTQRASRQRRKRPASPSPDWLLVE